MSDDRKKAWGAKVKKGTKMIESPLRAHPAPEKPLNKPIPMDEDWLAGEREEDSAATEE